MPITVLKVSKTIGDHMEVLGEFANEQEAHEFAQSVQSNDGSDEHDYLIEMPPSLTNHR